MGEKKSRSGICMIAGMALLAAAGIWGVMRLSDGKAAISGSSNAERIAFINECGWQTEMTHCELTEVRIPVNFDDVYEEYNDLQLMQGFDLRPYRAHSVKKYTYYITNYRENASAADADIFANLLVEDGKIIGADISSAEAGSFVTVLKYEKG